MQIVAAGAIISLIIGVQLFVLPGVHGRRAAADWIAGQAPTLPEEEVIALGHSVHWLIFYADRPLTRIDSLEELFDNPRSGPRWVLATDALLSDLALHGLVLEVRPSPEDPKVSESKRPVLVLFEWRRDRGVAD